MTRSILIIAILAGASVAAAETETADQAFKRGKAAQKAGRITEACAAFESSVKLDGKNVDAQLALAGCNEQDGKLMSAAKLYRAIAELDSTAARREKSLLLAAKLEARAPRLRLSFTPKVEGLTVTVDGLTVSPTADVYVDLGPHEVVATAPGYAGRASAPVDRERAIVDVIVRLETVATAPAPAPEAKPAPEPAAPAPAPAATPPPATTEVQADTSADVVPRKSNRKRNGIIVGAAGVGMLVGAAVLFKSSSDKFDEEQALCPMSRCRTEADLERAEELISQSRTRRGISIGMGIGSAALLGIATYLLVTDDRNEPAVAVSVDRGGASVAYTLRF
jgi:hypothetical protein